MRLEATHRVGKVTSHAAISRINVYLKIALKHQLILNYRLLCPETCPEVVIIGPSKKVSFQQVPQIDQFYTLLWTPSSSDHLLISDWLKFYDKKITRSSIIAMFCEDGNQFFKVHASILKDNNKFQIVVKLLEDCFFDVHFQAYKIYDLDHFSWYVLLVEARILNHKILDRYCRSWISSQSP